MADIISRIVLQATGGDQVAREAQKAKKGIDDLNKSSAAGGTGGGGGGTPSAFNRAVQDPTEANADLRRAAQEHYEASVSRRNQRHAEVSGGGAGGSGGGGGGGGGFTKTLSSILQRSINAGTMAAGGAPVEALGGGLQGLGKAGVVGAIAAAVGMAVAGANKLAEKDRSSIQSLFTGLGQSLGLGANDYDKFRDQLVKGLGGMGIGENAMPYASALAGAGGKWNYELAQTAMRLNMGYGVNASTLGTLQGKLQQAGINPAAMISGGFAGFQANIGGTGTMTAFYDTMEKAVSAGMELGFKKGGFGDVYTSMGRAMADLERFGGLTSEGASTLFSQMRTSIGGRAAGVRTPEDAALFMMNRKVGESYGTTVRRIATSSQQDQVGRILATVPNNPDAQDAALVSAFGINYLQAQALRESYYGRQAYDKSVAAGGVGAGGAPVIPSPDIIQRLATGAKIPNAFAGIQEWFGKLRTSIIGGADVPVDAFWQGMASAPGLSKFRGVGSLPGDAVANMDMLKYLPADVQKFAKNSLTDTNASIINRDVLGLLAFQNQVETGKIKPTKDEAALLTNYKEQLKAIRGAISGMDPTMDWNHIDKLNNDIGSMNTDGVASIVSIEEILTGIYAYLQSTVTTDNGSSN